jgi:hypothetical protein
MDKIKEILKMRVYGVMYRGNGYGPFFSREMAEDFASFIPVRNERKLGGTRMNGLTAQISTWDSLERFLETSLLNQQGDTKTT